MSDELLIILITFIKTNQDILSVDNATEKIMELNRYENEKAYIRGLSDGMGISDK